ncbi:hypothetical protein CWC03_14055 [Pseudoalteromonas sp. S2755]|nr:hypothetical protein CWC03_14055 [Pseudoalteromonas sp. S2755]
MNDVTTLNSNNLPLKAPFTEQFGGVAEIALKLKKIKNAKSILIFHRAYNARPSGEQLVASPAAESRDALGVC